MNRKIGQKRQPKRTEREVGIVLHVGNHTRFSGLIKERFSDFHVNEIDPNGKVLHLTSFELPREVQADVDRNDPGLEEWLTEDVQRNIKKLQEFGTYKSTKVEINVTAADKDQRTKIHRWISAFEKLHSETVDKDEEKVIEVYVPTNEAKRFVRRPYNRAKYTHCLLYKEGIDTTDAINFLCRKLKLQVKNITYAGTKDKQAKTVQRICFSNIEAKRLLELNDCSPHTKLGNFAYFPHQIRLGELKGNHFKILIKSIDCDPEVVAEAMNNLATKGFINYFGLQRFGTYKVPTYKVGQAIIQMKWLDAFDQILQTSHHDQPFMKQAKELWFKKRDAVAACKKIPHYLKSLESTLLHGLAKASKNDYLAAFKTLPRNMRTLYVHSYQSYMWNKLATFRIETLGNKPIVGDLVYVNSDLGDQAELFDNDDCSNDAEDKKSEDPYDSYEKPQVKVLTEEDLPNYTIYDVLLPLQGTEVIFPENSVKTHFDELLVENGVGVEDFYNFQPRGELPRGAYRRVMVLPTNVSHHIIPYNETDSVDTFIPSDLDIMKRKTEAEKPDGRLPIEVPKQRKAVVVEFSLPSCSYATMALRELLVGTDDEGEDEDGQGGKAEKRKLSDEDSQSQDALEAKRAATELQPAEVIENIPVAV